MRPPHLMPALFDLARRAPGVIGDTVRQSLAVPSDPRAGVLAGLATLATAFWNLPVVVLFILVVASGFFDLLTGARRARVRERLGLGEKFDRRVLDDGLNGKAIQLGVTLFLGMSMDAVSSLLGSVGELEFGQLFMTYTPATAALLAWRWAREMSSIVDNVESTPGGKGAIAPMVRQFINLLRFRMTNPGGGNRDKRWDDDLTPEESVWLQQRLGEHRAGSQP